MSRRSISAMSPWSRFGLSCAVAISALVAASSGIAVAQQPPEGATTAEKPSEAETGPRGQRMPRNIQYSAWRKLCFKSHDAKTLCRTSSSGTWDTGQMAVRVDLIERNDGAARLQIFLPVGLYLQPGVKVSVDDGTPLKIPYSWCLANLCVAGDRVAPGQIEKMDSGRKLTLQVVDANILTVATSLPLDQFAAAHKGPPAQVFDYQFEKDD